MDQSAQRLLLRPISPPPKKRRMISETLKDPGYLETPPGEDKPCPPPDKRRFDSPFHLTRIRDLPPELNVDTIGLNDILGDPLISECWEFNYLHDIDFLMRAFDQDVRHLVNIHVVHGFWKKDDSNRIELQQNQASRYKNVALHTAFMPEMFGTHHSKMMILLRHDDTAQIVIHTANLIVRDWTNMTQAVWLSPRLPLLPTTSTQDGSENYSPAAATTVAAASSQDDQEEEIPKTGSGAKFKIDFLNYLRSYDTRRVTCRPIIETLSKYDFSAVRGSLIASVPGRHNIHDRSRTQWGWAAMKQALRDVPVQYHTATSSSTTKTTGKEKAPEIVVQISSIATLGPTDSWLKTTLFRALSGGRGRPLLKFKVVFPTADEIRASLDGYGSGGSIHTKIKSPQQAKQLQYLHPIFYHWANDCSGAASKSPPLPPCDTQAHLIKTNPPSIELPENEPVRDAGRQRAAPHIKTYIRFANGSRASSPTIDWALVTSANLSKQAWGDAVNNSTGEARVASYEIGVLVWPALFAEDTVMKPAFLTDRVTAPAEKTSDEERHDGDAVPVVALRLPYSLPLQAYGKHENPWVATESYAEPDWKGQYWKKD
ncbi:tyrosyl-DNA phosphodiesterase I [Lasiosphaeria miniovina]|uniref:Tyrosyl-DNA phosphodiesterase I n=1 Tax=Lasiosphaeria miniovina TaxID=1954250 RepID=A0AA40DIA4_9PEZI|nr:tyrosyl-DNA phosphodiesterase I [Lasiosphaeria miniovina]KAK0701842.1 tyrosyl-DNA phosphodiesterase I [Lasiosphaeria miniovina]